MSPTLVFLPGLVCDAAVWQEVRQELGADPVSIVAEYGLASSLSAMAGIALAQAPQGPLVLIGHSMGGRVALEILRQAPQRVQAVCLLNTGHLPLASGEAGERERASRLSLLELAKSEGMLAMAQQWAPPMVHPSRHGTALFTSILQMLERRSPAVFEAQITALLGRPDGADVLRTASCPVVVATGREDGWSPPAQHEAMVALTDRAELHLLPNCGHMSPMEQPQAVAGLVRRTLELARLQREAEAAARAAVPAVQRIAFIGFGEAGSCLGKELAQRGVKVSAYDILYTDPDARVALQARADAAGVQLCSSLVEALEQAELVISAVTAASAAEAAHQAAAHLRVGQYFLDINSVSPETKRQDERAVQGSGAKYVECAVMAPVPPSGLRVPMLLGGAAAAELAPRLEATGFRARAVATRVGVASAIKMCRSVFIKGLESITSEGLQVARRYGAEDEVLVSLAETFPNMGWTTHLPDYLVSRVSEHGRRRAEEMREVAQTLRDVGLEPIMSLASARQQDAWIDAMEAAGLTYDSSVPFSWRNLVDQLESARQGVSRS